MPPYADRVLSRFAFPSQMDALLFTWRGLGRDAVALLQAIPG